MSLGKNSFDLGGFGTAATRWLCSGRPPGPLAILLCASRYALASAAACGSMSAHPASSAVAPMCRFPSSSSSSETGSVYCARSVERVSEGVPELVFECEVGGRWICAFCVAGLRMSVL